MSEKYYIEQGTEQDHFFIEPEWHVICTVNTQLECICLGKGEAELICRLLNEDEKRKSAPRIDKKFKEWANNELKLTIAHRSMYIDKEQWDENIRNLERLLNIVNSLEIQQ